MFENVNFEHAGNLNKHAGSCGCGRCRIVKRDTGPHEEKEHLARAHAMHHSAMEQKHQNIAYGERYREDAAAPRTALTTEQKAKHLEAASAHGMARSHFQEAAQSYREGLPKGAAEHEKIASGAADKANKMSEKLGQ